MYREKKEIIMLNAFKLHTHASHTRICQWGNKNISMWSYRDIRQCTEIGKIIARLSNCTLLNFRAFRIYLWLKIVVVAHGHIIPCALPGIHCG